MKNKLSVEGILPIVHTPNLTETAKYYRDVIGFTIDKNLVADDFIMLWAGLHQFGLRKTDGETVAVKGQSICIHVENLYEHQAQHRANGATFLFEVEDRPWGCKEYGIEDPNGYRLYFRECGFE